VPDASFTVCRIARQQTHINDLFQMQQFLVVCVPMFGEFANEAQQAQSQKL